MGKSPRDKGQFGRKSGPPDADAGADPIAIQNVQLVPLD